MRVVCVVCVCAVGLSSRTYKEEQSEPSVKDTVIDSKLSVGWYETSHVCGVRLGTRVPLESIKDSRDCCTV